MTKANLIIKKAYELGFKYESKFHNCCRCTVAALQDAFDKKDDAVFRAF